MMRERRSSDWVIDLQGRHGVEAEVEHALVAHPSLRLLMTSTASYKRLDFQLLGPGDRLLELEVKCKHQPLSAGWRALRPDVDPADLFVLDELALRKIVDAGRLSFLLIRDEPQARWFLWSVGDLLVATRARHARRLDAGTTVRWKGKLLFNLAETGLETRRLRDALDALVQSAANLETWWSGIEPWPSVGVVS